MKDTCEYFACRYAKCYKGVLYCLYYNRDLDRRLCMFCACQESYTYCLYYSLMAPNGMARLYGHQ